MSARMQFPLSQRRHTNVAAVRYSNNGVRLEIACYKNKVISYRSGTEDRLDEVLQINRIFSNVARGFVASEKDIKTVFGPDMEEEEAIKYMLIHGELQVAQHERTAEVDAMFKDIATFIAQKCINTTTQRPFPSFVISQGLKEIGAGVKLDHPVKKQALALMHQLIESQVIPIARANMKLRCLTKTTTAVGQLVAWCGVHGAQILEERDVESIAAAGTGTAASAGVEEFSIHILLQPHLFRELEFFVKTELPPGSTLNMVESSVCASGEDVGRLMASADASALSLCGLASGTTVGSSSTGAYAISQCEDTAASASDEDRRNNQKKQHSRNGDRSIKPYSSDSSVLVAEGGNKLLGQKKVSVGESIKKKKKNCNKKVRQGSNSDEEEESDGDSNEGVGKPKGGVRVKPLPPTLAGENLTAQLQQLHHDALSGLVPDNSNDEDTRGKGRKNNNKRNKKAGDAVPFNKLRPKASAISCEEKEQDSDAELEANRKERKKNTLKKNETSNSNRYRSEEEIFDYGEEELETFDE